GGCAIDCNRRILTQGLRETRLLEKRRRRSRPGVRDHSGQSAYAVWGDSGELGFCSSESYFARLQPTAIRVLLLEHGDLGYCLPGAAPGYRRQRRNSSLLTRRWRGFEPSVPRDTTNLSSRLWLVPANRKVGAKENRHTKRRALPPIEDLGRQQSQPAVALALEIDVYCLEGLVVEVLRQMLPLLGERQKLTGLRLDVFGLAVG